MAEFLQQLKTKVKVGLVGGSDLVKIAEQMGGDDGMWLYFKQLTNPHTMYVMKEMEELLPWMLVDFVSNV